MKIHRILILAAAAWGGTMVYKLHNTLMESDTATAGTSSSSSSHGYFSNVAGPGSLARTVRASSNAHNTSTAGDIPSTSSNYDRGQSGYSKQHGQSNAVEDLAPEDMELIQASAKGDKNLVEKRLSMHVKVDSRDGVRRTPLMYASSNGFDDISNRLLAAGANPELKDREGNNAFDYAAGRGLADSLHFLLQRTRTSDEQHYMEYATIMQATLAGDVSKLPEGSGRLASVNRINPEGQAPLHIAAGNGSVALMAALIQRGAQVNIANDTRQTPLHWAAWNNQPQAIQLLIDKGADITLTDAAGNTPLILAAQNGGAEAVKVLLAKGADKYISNKDGKNASIIAEDNGFPILVDLLK